MSYQHAPQLMTQEEVQLWADCFKDLREKGANLDRQMPTAAWKVEAMIATIQHLQAGGVLEVE